MTIERVRESKGERDYFINVAKKERRGSGK